MPIWGLFAIAIARPGVILGCRVANGRKSELVRAPRLAPWASERNSGALTA